MIGARSRWARLPEVLKRLEPHNPINPEVALHRAPKYIELGRQARPELWCPLTMQPPMLMWPLYDVNASRLDKL